MPRNCLFTIYLLFKNIFSYRRSACRFLLSPWACFGSTAFLFDLYWWQKMLCLSRPFFFTAVCVSDRQTYCIYPHYRNQFTGESPLEPGYLSACKWSDCISTQWLYCTLLKNCNDCISLCPLCNKECLSDFDTVTSVLSYIAFDFHKECSHMRWERLQILVDSVAETQDEYR